MPEDLVIGLKTIDMTIASPSFMSVPQRAHKVRVFTDAEWAYLNSLPTIELQRRVAYGNVLIGLMYRPELLNMTPATADELSSNVRYQQDAIKEIIESRGNINGTR